MQNLIFVYDIQKCNIKTVQKNGLLLNAPSANATRMIAQGPLIGSKCSRIVVILPNLM
jgi:hypothetical protein